MFTYGFRVCAAVSGHTVFRQRTEQGPSLSLSQSLVQTTVSQKVLGQMLLFVNPRIFVLHFSRSRFDLTPSDFLFSPKLKEHLTGTGFQAGFDLVLTTSFRILPRRNRLIETKKKNL